MHLLYTLITATLVAALSSTGAAAEGRITFPFQTAAEKLPPDYRKVAEKLARGYVMVTLVARGDPVTGDGGGDLHTGSGIVVGRNGHIVTAAHIARSKKFVVRLTFRDGRTAMGRIVAVDPQQEVALIKSSARTVLGRAGLEPLPIRMATPAKGEWLMAIGSPKKKWGVATLGRVRLPDIGERLQYGAWGFDSAIEVGMEVQSGHSGGPVVDMDGRLVGMVASYELGDTTKSAYVSPRITYVVPAKTLAAFLAQQGVR